MINDHGETLGPQKKDMVNPNFPIAVDICRMFGSMSDPKDDFGFTNRRCVAILTSHYRPDAMEALYKSLETIISPPARAVYLRRRVLAMQAGDLGIINTGLKSVQLKSLISTLAENVDNLGKLLLKPDELTDQNVRKLLEIPLSDKSPIIRELIPVESRSKLALTSLDSELELQVLEEIGKIQDGNDKSK